MAEFLLLIVVSCLIVLAGCTAVVFAIFHALVVRNRVAPSIRSSAPLHWLVSPEGAARLHRRLARAMAVAATVSAGRRSDDLGLGDVVAELRQRAVELDEQLVVASRSPKAAGRRMLRELHSEISEVEHLVQRTVRMSRAWTGSSPSERGLGAVRERLELLEAALRELDGVDVSVPASRRSREAARDTRPRQR